MTNSLLTVASSAAAVLAVVGLIFAVARWRAAAEREATWRNHAATAIAEAIRLRTVVASKETELVATHAALAKRMSADDLATLLSQLFGTGGHPKGRPAGNT
jgi:hypothetical protein